MKKISINMLSQADKVDGQGVGSAYLEQVELVKEDPDFEVLVNSNKKTDIIHCHTINPTFYLKMQKKNCASCCYVHFLPDTLDGSIKLMPGVNNLFKKYVVKFYKAADHLIVVNPIFISDLARYGIKKEKVTYIPNYVSRDNFYKMNDDEINKMKDEYNLDKNKFTVLGVGQVQTRKGVLDFIECAKNLPDMQFVWCGGFSFGKITDGYEELKKVMDNPPSNVKFVGIIPRNDMNKMYNICDCLFMPSYNELFPMSILEAVNIGKPLVLRNLDLYVEILFGKYIKGKNNKEFVNELKKLSTDKNYYDKYSKYSSEISDFYCKEHVKSLWNDFYKKIYEEYLEKSKKKSKVN